MRNKLRAADSRPAKSYRIRRDYTSLRASRLAQRLKSTYRANPATYSHDEVGKLLGLK